MAELSALDALLGAKPIAELTMKVRIERLGTEFTVKALSGEDVTKLREECTRYEIKGKERKPFIDNAELTLATIVAATLDPNTLNPLFKEAKLMEHYGAKTANQCVTKALTAGEINKLSDAVMTVSGLNDEEEEIDEIKNS